MNSGRTCRCTLFFLTVVGLLISRVYLTTLRTGCRSGLLRNKLPTQGELANDESSDDRLQQLLEARLIMQTSEVGVVLDPHSYFLANIREHTFEKIKSLFCLT
jgi:hypothetical protein